MYKSKKMLMCLVFVPNTQKEKNYIPISNFKHISPNSQILLNLYHLPLCLKKINHTYESRYRCVFRFIARNFFSGAELYLLK